MQKITNNFGSSNSSSSIGNMSSSGRHLVEEIKDDDHDHQEISRLAISNFQAREEEIERKKMEVKEKVELQLGRAEEETRRLAKIWEVSSLVF
ncbi:RAB6-interacting golgin [Trema orientale]|uniref:RAB6-interacting golgin n=1 Tax=Trema orientale TaxID=63057 RepID=A0A2P5B7N4_TREOI|nr:RAB6-interacting golgin [Trema orientale]